MKILFVGDASNFHATLASALRKQGHTVVVASAGSGWMNTARDISLVRGAGKWGAVKYLLSLIAALPKMRGFDVVHLVNPIFFELKPQKLRYFFDYLKRNNRSVFLSALGTDYQYVQSCYDGHTYRYSDYFVGDKESPYILSDEATDQKNWFLPIMRDYHNYVIDRIDGAVACLYEYFASYEPVIPQKLAYGGIPIDTDSLTPNYITEVPEKVRFFIGVQRKRNLLKGTDKFLEALQRVHDARPDECEMVVVENVPYAEYTKLMRSSHVMLDQLYSYTPATNALIAMAQGMVAVSGAEPEYYELIGESENQPIINVSPMVEGDIDAKLNWIIDNKHLLPELSRRSREFVVKHNDYKVVAQRHLDFWNKIINK